MAYVKCIRNLISSTVPDGKTVTPTDDISIWLACGGRSETYTTLSQVLADSTCLSALINDNNAIDYLVRSTTWASDICSDSSAMSYIGLNNYASNTLLADSTWCSAICNSTYFESVLNVKVPTMTSDTTPSGEAFYDFINYENQPAFYAFDGDSSTNVVSNGTTTQRTCHIGYVFTNAVPIYLFEWRANLDVGAYLPPATLRLQGSTSKNGTYENLSDVITPIADTNVYRQMASVVNPLDKAYRLECTDRQYSGNNYYYTQFSEIQFYGRADI